jgi:tyrosyl-tRNA synthetase
MNPMVPGIAGTKMSSSVPNSKIEFLDDAETVRQKIWNAPCADGKVEGNGLLSLLKLVVLPIHRNRVENSGSGEGAGLFRVRLDQSAGQENRYSSYDEVERDFEEGKITSNALKQALADSVCDIIAPLRKLYEGNEEWKAVERIAYSE